LAAFNEHIKDKINHQTALHPEALWTHIKTYFLNEKGNIKD
jgi:hypothetical protein